MTLNKDELKVHLRTESSKAVSALDNCIMAGAFMPLQGAIWLEVRFESLNENTGSWTVAHLSRPEFRISGSFYTSPNAPNVRTLNGQIEVSLAKHPSRGHVAQWDFDMAVQRSDVRGVRAGVE